MVPDEQLCEVRDKVRKLIGDVLDAQALALGRDKQDILDEVLWEWAQKQIHAATVLLRCVGRNAPPKE